MSVATEVWEVPVLGMTCGRCVRAVTEAIAAVPGVESATVDLQAGRASVSVDPGAATRESVERAIRGAGYRTGDERVPDEPAAPREGRG